MVIDFFLLRLLFWLHYSLFSGTAEWSRMNHAIFVRICAWNLFLQNSFGELVSGMLELSLVDRRNRTHSLYHTWLIANLHDSVTLPFSWSWLRLSLVVLGGFKIAIHSCSDIHADGQTLGNKRQLCCLKSQFTEDGYKWDNPGLITHWFVWEHPKRLLLFVSGGRVVFNNSILIQLSYGSSCLEFAL